jgi:hypothetical protein
MERKIIFSSPARGEENGKKTKLSHLLHAREVTFSHFLYTRGG